MGLQTVTGPLPNLAVQLGQRFLAYYVQTVGMQPSVIDERQRVYLSGCYLHETSLERSERTVKHARNETISPGIPLTSEALDLGDINHWRAPVY